MLKRTEPIAESPVTPARPDAPQAFRWKLAGSPLPSVVQALRIGEAARDALYKTWADAGLWPLPDAFHRGLSDFHDHAYWLPEDADGDRLIDHVVLFAESGLPDQLVPGLAGGSRFWAWPDEDWRLLPDWMGRRAPGALFGPAETWSTATAYIQPHWGRRAGRPEANDPIAEHIAFEAHLRGLPPPVRISVGRRIVSGARSIRADSFVRGTRKRRASGISVAAAVEIQFAEPVWGPLAFGFGAHFGLGLFEPADAPFDDRGGP